MPITNFYFRKMLSVFEIFINKVIRKLLYTYTVAAWLVNSRGHNVLYKFCGAMDPSSVTYDYIDMSCTGNCYNYNFYKMYSENHYFTLEHVVNSLLLYTKNTVY